MGHKFLGLSPQGLSCSVRQTIKERDTMRFSTSPLYQLGAFSRMQWDTQLAHCGVSTECLIRNSEADSAPVPPKPKTLMSFSWGGEGSCKRFTAVLEQRVQVSVTYCCAPQPGLGRANQSHRLAWMPPPLSS